MMARAVAHLYFQEYVERGASKSVFPDSACVILQGTNEKLQLRPIDPIGHGECDMLDMQR